MTDAFSCSSVATAEAITAMLMMVALLCWSDMNATLSQKPFCRGLMGCGRSDAFPLCSFRKASLPLPR